MADIVLRPVTEAEWPAYVAAVARQFGEDNHADDAAAYRKATDLDRTLAAFDAQRIVGTADAFEFRCAVPGGADLPCAGVTAVGVRTTHRRRGLLRAMMRELLDDARGRGEPLAALYASEAPIYGRFGFGPAAPTVSFKAERAWTRFLDPVPTDGIDLIEADEALQRYPAIHEQARGQRGGMISLSAAMWDLRLGTDPERHRDGFSARYHAVLGDRGYLVYRMKHEWDNAPAGVLRVTEMVATDPQAAAALWQFCFSVDLMTRVEAFQRPPDDPLPWLVADQARVRTASGEPLYVRLVDLPTALCARAYAVADSVVLEVRDEFCPWNTGRWRLDATGETAVCEPTEASPDLSMTATVLATAYLGGERFSMLAGAGAVQESTPGALRRADLMFTAPRAPWNSWTF